MSEVDELFEKAKRYARLLDSSVNDPKAWKISINNLSLLTSNGAAGNSNDGVKEFILDICNAYEEEFRRMGINY